MTKRKGETLTPEQDALNDWIEGKNFPAILKGIKADHIDIDHKEDTHPDHLQECVGTDRGMNMVKEYLINYHQQPGNPWSIPTKSIAPSPVTSPISFQSLLNTHPLPSDSITLLGWDASECQRLQKHDSYMALCFFLDNIPNAKLNDAIEHFEATLDLINREESSQTTRDAAPKTFVLFGGRADKEDDFFNIVIETGKNLEIVRLFFIPKNCSRLT